MAGQYTLSEALYSIFDQHICEEEREQKTDNEDGLDEEVSEAEVDMEYNLTRLMRMNPSMKKMAMLRLISHSSQRMGT